MYIYRNRGRTGKEKPARSAIKDVMIKGVMRRSHRINNCRQNAIKKQYFVQGMTTVRSNTAERDETEKLCAVLPPQSRPRSTSTCSFGRSSRSLGLTNKRPSKPSLDISVDRDGCRGPWRTKRITPFAPMRDGRWHKCQYK